MDASWLASLATLGEWMAYGYYEAATAPWPIPYGRAWRRLYERMEVRVLPDRWLAPAEPLPHARTMESHGTWYATSLICDFAHHSGLRLNHDIASLRQAEHPELAPFIATLCADLAPRLRGYGGYTHSNPDIRRVVGEGFLAMDQELEGELAAVQALGAAAPAGELPFLLALQEYSTGVKALHARTLQALTAAAQAATGPARVRREAIATAFATSFLWPAETFLEGLLAVNFTWMLDGCDSLGRFDQVLGPLFERDRAAGTLDLEFARDLLDEVWRNFERFNGWNLQLGGRRPDGADGSNELTRECLRACGRNTFRRPNVAFRITSDTPDALLGEALQALAHGSGRPALYHDDLYIKSLQAMNLGLSAADAREVGFGGCTETMIAGLSNVGSLEGEIHLAKALELALHDGYDPVAKKQVGPHTGAFAACATFAAFVAALKRQIQYQTDAFVAHSKRELAQRFTAGDPKLYRSFFTRDCVRRHKSFEAGGARYNWSVVSYQGIANTIDSLAAIKQLVYDERVLAADELLAALRHDFRDREDLRQRLLAAPKFGNDLPAVDALGRDLLEFAWRELASHETPRGGRYLASCILFTTYLGAGRVVGATPDGRHAFTALADSVGPCAGRDRHGPTAMLNSVCSLPLTLAVGTPVLNLRLSRSMFRDAAGLAKIVCLVRTYFQQGGLQLQLSVLDSQELRAAQREPAKYADLVVRIGGFSEYFTRLDPALQDSVIARSEHGV